MTDESEDPGTDVSDVESTDSASKPQGSMVIKHRTNSSLGNHLDLVNRMVSRWGSMGDGELDGITDDLHTDDLHTDSDYDSNDPNKEKQKSKSKSPNPNPPNPNTNNNNNNNNKPKKPTHRRKKSATDEVKILKLEREALEGAFDQYIDPDQNGDVDVEEWFLGIQKLNVQLNEHQQRRIYNLMDKEESGFIEKDDFVTFATAKWDNEDLQTLQKPILEAVRVQNLHNRTHSNLMNPVLSQDWTDYDMELLEQEMASAMTGMVEVMQVEVNTELEFENEMKDRIEKNPELLDSSNAFKWTKFEVAHWITQLGMERYSRYFAQESVDGPMLLEDMTQEMLETNLGVRTIHAKKILREITTLKKAVRGVTDLLLDESEFVCTHNIDDIDMKIKQLAIHEELKKTQRQKDQLKKFYENELMKLNKIIIELKNGKKGKRKHKNKKNKVEEKIILPQPPMEYDNSMQSNDSIISPQFGMGVLTPLTENNQNKINNNDIIDENDNINANENVDDDNNDNDNEENKEIENQIDIEQKQEDLQQEIKESDNDSDEDEDDISSDSDSESDDEYGGKKLLNMTQSHLMSIRSSPKGPSPKQLNRFIKDINRKKQQGGDSFCVIDIDTIESWNKLEVAYWIISIGFEQYAFKFYALPIDGDMLIRDMNKESIIEDLGIMKIHSNRILRQIDKLRKIINERFDNDIMDLIHIEPDLERPTKDIIESLQERIEKLTNERDDIMKELENKENNNDDDEQGYFTKKVNDLEAERNALQEEMDGYMQQIEQQKSDHNEEVDHLNNNINEANNNIDELKKVVKGLKKDVRKAKRAGFDGDDDDMDDYDDEESDIEEIKDDDDEPVEITHSRDEIESQIRTEMEENTTFGLEEKVLEWSPAEVCQWLKNIQFGPYIEVFYSAQIFGDVLIQDVGSRMLKRFRITSMHIPKLLRQIAVLRKTVIEKGVRIQLSDEIKKEMNPEKYKSENNKNKNQSKKKINYKELEAELKEKENKFDELSKQITQKEEQITEWEQQFDEEKQVRIAVELELEQVKQEYKVLADTGGKDKILKLENYLSTIEESKIRTVRDLNDQLNSLRIGCRLMQKEIAYLKTKQGFHPIDSLVSTLGYSAPPKY